MEILIKEKKQTYFVPDLLLFKEVEERLDVCLTSKKITWTDQNGTEKDITELTDAHAANLARWLRERGHKKAERIIQAELERRCTNVYPEDFNELIESYKSSPDIWRMKVY